MAETYGKKEAGIAYALMLFTLIGVAGVQHFYMGKIARGIIWLLTFGLLGIGRNGHALFNVGTNGIGAEIDQGLVSHGMKHYKEHDQYAPRTDYPLLPAGQ